MIINPKFRGFVCTTAHPEGCAKNVTKAVDYVKGTKPIKGPKNVLVIGASTGYGLASRIVSTFGAGAGTIGVVFERSASENRTATAGWYNTAAFEKYAGENGYYSATINGDAFSKEIKEETIELIKKDLGKVDLVIYSIASAKRIHPVTGEVFSSVLKPIGKTFKEKTVNFHSYQVSDMEINPADEDEVRETVAVMGGEDWKMWIDSLIAADVLAEGAITTAYSYIGPEITYPVYRNGSIGKAKKDLEKTAEIINKDLEKINGKAVISVNKALVTQSSLALPVVPLYISILSKVMKEKGIDEGCIEQIYRLFSKELYKSNLSLDDEGRIRMDDLELRSDVQKEVFELWKKINTDNITELSDIEEFRNEFFKLFGFGYSDIDYDNEVDQHVKITSVGM
ncbi:enoyl-ACP reductase FabV [Clostridium sp. BL-8]|uniref:enoyl-ACP reductase FabV n=1 Tax=Clostridium sp. BL-8 TaxID=349938 RepID=UPI00098C588D|nr:enoyl-ACP reductase FabV [Clostridium sp. BL-8]OOM81303.1 putative reductase [Clostridium sp. BL-8]